MIRELSDLGKKIRTSNSEKIIIHNALKEEPVSIDLVIDADGCFKGFICYEKKMTTAEAITAKKGKARLLLDKAEEVLGYGGDGKKHRLFLDKLALYEDVTELKPVFAFYSKNKTGVEKARDDFERSVPEKGRTGNISFRIANSDIRIHEEPAVYQRIISLYEQAQKGKINSNSKLCSICGRRDYPVEDVPHGMIKRVPDGQTSGCALVSYNCDAFESYGLEGNVNSSICTNCSRTYVEGLNWLMQNGSIVSDEKGKERLKYSNRKNFGSDTAIVFWTRESTLLEELDQLEEPNPQEVNALIESVVSGKDKSVKYLEEDKFYSCSLSGVAARIAIRDWMEMSLHDFRASIAKWFGDIRVQYRGDVYYSRLYNLARCCQNEKEDKDYTLSRVASILWRCALKNTSPPLWVLSAVLKRSRLDGRGVTPERAALIRLVLNRNNKGGMEMQEKLDVGNRTAAYTCGRIFAVLESVQRAALGKDINAGIRERFFAFASTNPSAAFGRLMKLSQNHLTKLKGEKPGLAVVLDKELQALFKNIDAFQAVFSLEEQGQFSIGYYHQKEHQFNKTELKETVEEA